MKTTMNIRPIAKMSFAAIAFFAASSSIRVKATEKDTMEAFERLDKMNITIEASLKYKAPEATEAENFMYTANAYYMEVVNERLEDFNSNMEQSVRYQAPQVTEDVENHDVEAAMERLENYHMAVEKSIKF